MAPRQFVAKPTKVLAEQYLVATVPPIAGVCTLEHDPYPDGRPHAHVEGVGAQVLHDTDVLVWSVYAPDVIIDVQPLAEFEDRFGPITA